MEFDTNTLKPAHLKRIRALADLSPGQLAHFLEYVEFLECKKNHLLFQEGDPADCMYLILYGRVRATTEKKRRHPYFLRHLEAGETFGEIALLDEGRRSATTEVSEDSLLLKLDEQNLRRLIIEEPGLANQFLLRLCIQLGAHLRDLTKRVGHEATLREALQPLT